MTFEPLKGLKILDLTSVVVGPVATWRLAQYGAEVIKVENPGGDLMRGLGGQSPTGQHSGTYLHLNRGKRNICLDLKSKAAMDALSRLIAQCDIIVANMRPQALERLGIGPRAIRARHPEKIYCLLTGFGTEGPYGGLPAYDSVIQAVSGIAGLSQMRDGEPRYVPLLICDHVVGEIAAGAILAASVEMKATGKGRFLEIPMFETMAAFVLQEHLAQHSFDPSMGPPGDRRLLSSHNAPVRTSDGYISVTINTDSQVRAFLQVTDRAELADDPRFNSILARADNVNAWFEVRGAALQGKTTDEWIALFRKADVPAMPCHTLETLTHDAHLEAVGLLDWEIHPVEGRVAKLRTSLLVDGDPIDPRTPASAKGWDTRDILADAGLDQAEIEYLLLEGAAFEYPR